VITGNLKPLKWLEPVDDTVERVAGVIFGVAVLTGVLSISMGPVSAVGFLLVAIGLLGRCGCDALFRRGSALPARLARGLKGCNALGLGIAVGLPVSFALGAWVGDALTHSTWVEADATLGRIAAEARTLIGEPGSGGGDPGWRETLTAYLGAAGTFWNEADELLQASLTLVGVFVLRTVILPVLVLLALWKILRSLTEV
jgi:hypothetical protein